MIKNIIDAFELGIYPKSTCFGEPNLGKRGLHFKLAQKNPHDRNLIFKKLDLIAYSNGKNNIFEISNLLQIPLKELCKEYKLLKFKKLLK